METNAKPKISINHVEKIYQGRDKKTVLPLGLLLASWFPRKIQNHPYIPNKEGIAFSDAAVIKDTAPAG